ncbi:MAG: aminotransferase class IV [Acidimicrobiales bacterium]
MDTAVWIDGRVTGPAMATVPADDHGLLVGDGAFETLLVVNEPVRGAFAVGRHVRRLRRSCAVLGMDCGHSDDDLRLAISTCIEAAPSAGVVRLTVTSGRGPLGSQRGPGPGRLIVVAGGGIPDHPPGTAVSVFSHPRNERGVMAGVKTTSYAESVVALRYAHERGATEAIFADTAGHVCEGTGSNIFWTDGHRLHTPPLSTGCLAGVTRALVMERLEVIETELSIDELERVPEAFLTSTTRVVQSIATVDGADLEVCDGPLTKEARSLLENLMATDVDP